MKILLERINDNMHFKASNEAGHTLELSGDGLAVGPMESLLSAIAGCSTIDIVMVLKKMRQNLQDVKVEVTGTRREEIPQLFTKIHMHYKLIGGIKDKKAKEAIDLSVEKYCSVSKMLEKTAEITTSYEIIDAASLSA